MKNIEFLEHIFSLKSSGTSKQHIDSVSDDISKDVRRSKRQRNETSFGDDFYTYLVENDPISFSEVTSVLDAKFWDKAIRIEIDSINKNNTWTLVDMPKGAKLIGCKWIFKNKYHHGGSKEKYKERLVAKDFTQKPNIDYFYTFALLTRISSIRVLQALTYIHKQVIHQMDVKITFLNGELEEEIYMTKPEEKVCKFLRSLYGLKQEPK